MWWMLVDRAISSPIPLYDDKSVMSFLARALAGTRLTGRAKYPRAIEDITLTTDFVILRACILHGSFFS
jgi:hypothetical protein